MGGLTPEAFGNYPCDLLLELFTDAQKDKQETINAQSWTSAQLIDVVIYLTTQIHGDKNSPPHEFNPNKYLPYQFEKEEEKCRFMPKLSAIREFLEVAKQGLIDDEILADMSEFIPYWLKELKK